MKVWLGLMSVGEAIGAAVTWTSDPVASHICVMFALVLAILSAGAKS